MTINYKGAFRPVISRVQGVFFVKLLPMKSPNPLIRLGSRNFYYRYTHFSPLWRLSPEPPSALTGQGLKALFPAIFFRQNRCTPWWIKDEGSFYLSPFDFSIPIKSIYCKFRYYSSSFPYDNYLEITHEPICDNSSRLFCSSSFSGKSATPVGRVGFMTLSKC